jgi:hypothetical protein
MVSHSHNLQHRLTEWAIVHSPPESVERLFDASPRKLAQYLGAILRKQPDADLLRLYDEFEREVIALAPDLAPRCALLSAMADVEWWFSHTVTPWVREAA